MELHAVFEEPGGGDNLVVGMLFEVSKENNRFIQVLINAGLPLKIQPAQLCPVVPISEEKRHGIDAALNQVQRYPGKGYTWPSWHGGSSLIEPSDKLLRKPLLSPIIQLDQAA